MTQKLHYLCTLLLCMIASVGWGQNTSTLMFKDKCNGSGTASDGAIWTVTSDATESTYGGDDGIHYGTSSATVTYLHLTTNDISGTITQVTVKTRDAQAKAAVTVTVGGTSFTCNGNTSVTATNTSTEYVFVGSGSGEIVVRVDRGSPMKKALYLKSIKVVYSAGGSSTPTCATPTFSPSAGAVAAGSTVTISTTTDDATIYYTTDGSTPSASNGTQGTSVTVNQAMTIKAIAVKDGAYSEVAEASYTIKQAVSGYNIDFESELDCYVNWNFDNVGIHTTGVTSAHGGSAWGSNVNSSDNGTETAEIKTKEKVAYPDVFTCYISKESSNNKESSWKIQVSSDGSEWNDIATLSTMTQNTWTEFTGDIKAKGYTNVYVRLYYEGTSAKRAVDDISLTTYTPVAVEAPSITVPNEFTFSTSATISCITDDATIYYSFDNINWTEYTGVLNITSTTTIYAKAVKGNDESAVAQKTTTKILETPIVTISSTSINVGETATISANGLDVSLTTNDAAIASVEGATVTGVAAGTATITATWDATSDYSGGTKEFVVTVSDPNGPGSASKPYTVVEALEAPAANGKYVTGKVSQIDEVSTQYGNATYWISTDGTTESDQLKIYRGKYLEEASFTSVDQLQVGDVVVVYGELKLFNAVNQMAQGNYLISLTRKSIPTLTFEEEAYSVVKNGELKIIATSSNSTGAITYQSSNTDVAEIEATTGVVTAKAAGTTTITATIAATEEYNTTTATVELTVTAPKHKVTFYQDGTKLSEAEFTEDTPITFPDAEPIINGKTFVGWINAPINGTIENAPATLVTSASMGESDITYYAVYAKVEGEGSQPPVTDELTLATTGVEAGSTSYTSWSGKTANSSAVYAGQSAGDKNSIQLRSKNSNSGIITTISGGRAKNVVVTWNSENTAGRTLDIYGSNTAYAAVSDLYAANTQGTKLGSITFETRGNELSIDGEYEYIGLRSNDGAIYLDKIDITWESGTPATYSDYCTTVKTYVAQVGDVKYETFADAVEAAAGGDITLLADIEEPYTLAEGQTLTVNHNGHSLTVNPPAGYILDMTELGETTIAYTYTQAVAKIGDKLYASLQDAIEDAEAGATIDVQQDVDATDYYSSNTARMPISKSMTINGNGHTVTVAGRGFGVGMNASDKIDVTFKDITIQNSSAGARCIDTRGNLNSLTLENATLKTDGAQSGYTQPLTIGGNQSDVAKVNITNSNIQTNDEGTAYYAIITFNPVEMNITNSTIKGWAAIYAKGVDGSAGSAGSVFTLDGCTLVSSNAYSGVSNSFAAFMTEDNNVTYNIKNSKITINNSGDQIQAIASYQLNNTLTRNSVTLGEGNEVTFVEPGTFAYVNNQNEGNTFVITGGTYNVDPTPYLAEGLAAPLIGGVYTVMPASAIPTAPIIFHDGGEYEDALTVAIAGEGTIMYTLNDGETQTYSAPFTIKEDATIKAWAVKDGVASDVTEPKTFTIKEKAKGAVVEDGYYTIKTNDGKYVNVAGRKTVTLVSDTKSAGTVIRVKADEEGVKVLRSQAVDLPRYAERAMSYVPEIVKEVVKKLAANVDDPIIGEQGADLILDKFNQEFDYHLYLEGENNTYRIYGRTPSMKPVVDFYAENKELVDSRLPKVEDFVKEVLQKIVDKVGHGQSVVDMFKVKTVWENMGGTLTDPDVDQAKFFEEVLSSEKNTWDFAYQTGMLYWDKVKSYLEDNTSELGDYGKYIEKIPQIRPNFKYYIVPSASGVDIISEGNSEIADASTAWTLTKRESFDVTFDATLSKNEGKEMYKTLYVDFAYELPENVKALKVTGVTEAGVAETEEITGVVPAQTPVLLMSTDVENLTKTLALSTADGAAVTHNLLVGADYLINKYEINTPQVESIFTLLAKLSQSLANEYSYLKRKNAGTVNNKYFFGLTEDDLNLCTYKNENNENDCVVRSLSMGEEKLGFYNNWTANANEAFLVSEKSNPILLTLKGDVYHDGVIDNKDLTALVEIVLGKVTLVNKPENYDFDAAHVNEDEDINIADVTALVNILKPQPQD